ncbi:MAG: hypothetical protein A2X84_00725 [Desulfuromonadaceae bacterium GWC2_58_13]|nr:MAG: hypothetical protein A2X84_00725 [Desulfuromonadaceae bacterium GWC2_58_13]
MKFMLSVLGVVLIIEGIPWFLSPRMMQKALRQLTAIPESSLRILGALLMFCGLLLVYLAVG